MATPSMAEISRRTAASGHWSRRHNRPIGWAIANFEGDRQPLGLHDFRPGTQTFLEEPDHPVSTANPSDSTFLDPRMEEALRQFLTRFCTI